ncbi:TPA: hypothetical protein L2Z78_004708 [Escherichia coli]|nr:hypothetical protein [Escherichia coli]
MGGFWRKAKYSKDLHYFLDNEGISICGRYRRDGESTSRSNKVDWLLKEECTVCRERLDNKTKTVDYIIELRKRCKSPQEFAIALWDDHPELRGEWLKTDAINSIFKMKYRTTARYKMDEKIIQKVFSYWRDTVDIVKIKKYQKEVLLELERIGYRVTNKMIEGEIKRRTDKGFMPKL